MQSAKKNMNYSCGINSQKKIHIFPIDWTKRKIAAKTENDIVFLDLDTLEEISRIENIPEGFLELTFSRDGQQALAALKMKGWSQSAPYGFPVSFFSRLSIEKARSSAR